MQLEAQIIESAAQESLSREWEEGRGLMRYSALNAQSPAGTGQTKANLTRKWGITCDSKQDLWDVPKCGESLFRLDEELGLLPGTLAPQQ